MSFPKICFDRSVILHFILPYFVFIKILFKISFHIVKHSDRLFSVIFHFKQYSLLFHLCRFYL